MIKDRSMILSKYMKHLHLLNGSVVYKYHTLFYIQFLT